MRIAIYPGSFDPITNGHLDILNRALKAFDKVIVLVANNANKPPRFDVKTRLEMIKEATSSLPNVEVDYTDGLTVEYAKKHGSKHLIRGLRAVTDFEYEFQLASINEYIDPEVDMVFFMSRDNMSFISSSNIISLFKSGVDISSLVPESVIKRLRK